MPHGSFSKSGFGPNIPWGSLLDLGVSENRGTLFGALIIRILLFRVLCSGPLFSETPT